jgi:hypothetical protein
VGRDVLSGVGFYSGPNPFNGVIRSTRVEAGGAPPVVAEPMPREQIGRGLKTHERALFIHNLWFRDPYIATGPDGVFYLTGTTSNEGDLREKLAPYNSGLGSESIVGSAARVWKSLDLIQWESMGAPFSLRDGIWFNGNRNDFDSTPQDQWRLWAPELHWVRDH